MENRGQVVRIKPFVYSPSSDSWVPLEVAGAKPLPQKNNLRFATYNVLHDRNPAWREPILQSPKRNTHMLKLITELEADFIGLNEVTVSILTMILSHPIIKEHFYVSDVPETAERTVNMTIHERCPFGNILLSRLPFSDTASYLFVEPTCKRKVIFGIFSHAGINFMVGAMHTTAYDNNRAIRKIQIDEIVACVQNMNFGNNIFVMGDFNFHSELENQLIEPLFVDLWKATHDVIRPSAIRPVSDMMFSYMPYAHYYYPPDQPDDEDDGYTFDAVTNTFIPFYIPFERRRMRLDRIIMKQGCQFEPVGKMRRFGTQPVEPGSYLFASDHYGLYIDLKPKL